MVAMDIFLNDDSNSHYKYLLLFLASLGSVTFLYYSLSLLTLLYHILIPGIPLSTFRKSSPNPWALITGPTSGIGKSYAHALANAKFNLILVSRSQTKLDSLAQEIKTKYPDCAIRTVAVDLASEFGGEVRAVCEEVTQEGGDVRVLVNNAGRGHEMPTEFKDVEREEMEGIVGVNVCGVLRITKDVLPFMLNDKSPPTRRRVVDGRKKKRLIINVGSFAAYAPTPLLATYTGTKGFISTWSLATKHELSADNIVVQHLNAYLITTKLAKIRHSSLLIPTEDAFVRAALRNIGRDSSPYWSHAVYEWVLGYMSVVIGGREGSVVAKINKGMHQGIRRRALKKVAKAKAT